MGQREMPDSDCERISWFDFFVVSLLVSMIGHAENSWHWCLRISEIWKLKKLRGYVTRFIVAILVTVF